MNETELALKIHHRRSGDYVKEKKIGEAIQELKICLSIDPKDFTAYFLLAQIYFASKKFDAAEKFCQQAIIYSTADVRPWVILGNIFISRQDYDLAITQLPLGIKVDPRNYQLKYLIGYSYAKKKDYANARKYLEEALAIQPGNAQCLKALEVVKKSLEGGGA
jgi:tetratricopeptide (TPR) repeat protein